MQIGIASNRREAFEKYANKIYEQDYNGSTFLDMEQKRLEEKLALYISVDGHNQMIVNSLQKIKASKNSGM